MKLLVGSAFDRGTLYGIFSSFSYEFGMKSIFEINKKHWNQIKKIIKKWRNCFCFRNFSRCASKGKVLLAVRHNFMPKTGLCWLRYFRFQRNSEKSLFVSFLSFLWIFFWFAFPVQTLVCHLFIFFIVISSFLLFQSLFAAWL